MFKYFLKWDVDLNREVLDGYRYCKRHPLDAQLIISQLKRLDEIIENQKKNACEIIQFLRKTDLAFHLQEGKNHTYTKLSVIFDNEHDCLKLQEALHRASIVTEEMYTPLHTRDFSKGFFNGENLANAEKVYKNVFNVPVRPNLSRRQIERIKRAIENVNAARG